LSDPLVFVHDFQVPGLHRPPGLRAGFHAESDDPASGLRHAGEQWAPARFRIDPHRHPVWELYLQADGVSRWSAGGERVFTLRPGQLFAVAPEVTHHMTGPPSGDHHFYFAALDPAPALARHPAFADAWHDLPTAVHRDDAHSLAEPFAALIRELTVRQALSGEGLLLAVDRLVLEVTRLLLPDRPAPRLALHPAVVRVRDLLERDYRRPWTIAELADLVGLAPTYLAGVFARDVGLSPHRYLTQRRVERAQQLLQGSDLSVTAIALEVGFSSGQHLARVFRQLTGVRPLDYRRATRPDQPGAAGPGADRH
jgi:AraC-like DNA-binding protein